LPCLCQDLSLYSLIKDVAPGRSVPIFPGTGPHTSRGNLPGGGDSDPGSVIRSRLNPATMILYNVIVSSIPDDGLQYPAILQSPPALIAPSVSRKWWGHVVGRLDNGEAFRE